MDTPTTTESVSQNSSSTDAAEKAETLNLSAYEKAILPMLELPDDQIPIGMKDVIGKLRAKFYVNKGDAEREAVRNAVEALFGPLEGKLLSLLKDDKKSIVITRAIPTDTTKADTINFVIIDGDCHNLGSPKRRKRKATTSTARRPSQRFSFTVEGQVTVLEASSFNKLAAEIAPLLSDEAKATYPKFANLQTSGVNYRKEIESLIEDQVFTDAKLEEIENQTETA